jgi:hypothetical protein
VKRILTVLTVIAAVILTVSAGAAAHVRVGASQIRIGGVGFSSLGTGALDLTPGVESVTLLNYSFSPKNLKGYSLKDKAGNVVPLCAVVSAALVDCTSVTDDHDSDTTVNASDADAWITLAARSQMTINVEIRNDGPWLNDGGDTIYLLNSVGRVLTKFVYAVSNPSE